MNLTHVRFQGTPSRKLNRMGPHWVPSATAAQGAALTTHLHSPISGLPSFVLAQAGLDPTMYREAPLRRRTAACLRAIRAESEMAALTRLPGNPSLADVALNALLIGVSDFFRDPVVFHTLQTTVIPALEQRRRPPRVASIGCSSGAELYSVAMLLAEANLLDRSYLLGIDCRPAAVDFARAGRFADSALGELGQGLRARYFEPAPGGGRIVGALRQRTDWRVLDATRHSPLGPWDIVLCRNLVIYLRNTAADAMFERLAGELVPGGFLVVGNAERPPASLNFTQVARCVYRTHGL